MLENPRHEKFCQLFAADGNATAAYLAAGYRCKSEAAARACSARLLQVANIRARIAELTAEARRQAEQSAIADIVEIRQRVTQVLRGQCELETKSADVLKAADLLARIGGAAEPQVLRVELSLSDKRARLRDLLKAEDGDDLDS